MGGPLHAGLGTERGKRACGPSALWPWLSDLRPQVQAGRVVAPQVEVVEHGVGEVGVELQAAETQGAHEGAEHQRSTVPRQHGGAKHGVASPVPHDPDHTRPHQEGEGQPAVIRDAPDLWQDRKVRTTISNPVCPEALSTLYLFNQTKWPLYYCFEPSLKPNFLNQSRNPLGLKGFINVQLCCIRMRHSGEFNLIFYIEFICFFLNFFEIEALHRQLVQQINSTGNRHMISWCVSAFAMLCQEDA